MRLLVVEDEPRVAAALARGLRRHGAAVDVAEDGSSALFHARVHPYDVVLLDRDLPAARVEPLLVHTKGTYREDAFGAEETRTGVAGTGRTLWRTARLLGRIDDALDARPKGKLRHRALSNLPIVGVLGGYAAEREGLRRAAARAGAVLDEEISG